VSETDSRPDEPALVAAELAAALAAGDTRALARAITLAESSRDDHRAAAEALVALILPRTGNAVRLGISGAPGVGKSTLIERLGTSLIAAGHRVAVLAIDPSSPVTGGSILGDKTRMEELARNPGAFIRPSPSGGVLGGVTRHTAESILLAEAAGFDIVIVETVGIGQSEVAVADMVDLFAVLLAPAGGDALQGIKKGVIELADLLLVTKADGALADAASQAVADYRAALSLLRPPNPPWRPEVLACSARLGTGLEALWQTVGRYCTVMRQAGAWERRRAAQAGHRLWAEIGAALLTEFRGDPIIAAAYPALERAIIEGTVTPSGAARQLLALRRERAADVTSRGDKDPSEGAR
jgi:LAO/AO transport system kinase